MPELFNNGRCVPCEGGVEPLDGEEIKYLIGKIDNWRIFEKDDDGKKYQAIQKRIQFINFRKVMNFLRDVEDLAEEQGHHPDFCVHYNTVDITIWTHAIGGLHLNDFIIASGIDKIAVKHDI